VNLLIAEDNDPDIFLIRQALSAAGLMYQAQTAYNGEQVLSVLAACEASPERKLHGMVLDLNLTTHTGFEILRYLRASPAWVDLPVVILTSSDSPEDRRQAEALHAAGYFRKPLDLEDFMRIGVEIAAIFGAAQSAGRPANSSTPPIQ